MDNSDRDASIAAATLVQAHLAYIGAHAPTGRPGQSGPRFDQDALIKSVGILHRKYLAVVKAGGFSHEEPQADR